jgi:hypothetical protein
MGAVSIPTPVRPSRAVRRLTYLAAFAASGVGLSIVHTATGVGLPCPFRTVTGWECPLCGGTRLGSALLRGDVVAAFFFNPAVLVGLVVLSVLGLLWTLEALGGPVVRLPARVAVPLARVRPTQWLVVGLAAATAFVVLRNLL